MKINGLNWLLIWTLSVLLLCINGFILILVALVKVVKLDFGSDEKVNWTRRWILWCYITVFSCHKLFEVKVSAGSETVARVNTLCSSMVLRWGHNSFSAPGSLPWWKCAPPPCHLKVAAVLTHALVWFPILFYLFIAIVFGWGTFEVHQPNIRLIYVFIHLSYHRFLQTKVSKANWITLIPKCIWIDSTYCRNRLSNIPL